MSRIAAIIACSPSSSRSAAPPRRGGCSPASRSATGRSRSATSAARPCDTLKCTPRGSVREARPGQRRGHEREARRRRGHGRQALPERRGRGPAGRRRGGPARDPGGRGGRRAGRRRRRDRARRWPTGRSTRATSRASHGRFRVSVPPVDPGDCWSGEPVGLAAEEAGASIGEDLVARHPRRRAGRSAGSPSPCATRRTPSRFVLAGCNPTNQSSEARDVGFRYAVLALALDPS